MAVDVAVVGSGVAGLSAALACARLGLETVVLGELIGGELLSIAAIDGYPGFPEGIAGYDLGPMIQEQAAAAGARCEASSVQQLVPSPEAWRVSGDHGELGARAVVLATGARFRPLGVPGEDALRGRGVSHCASCDGPLLRGKTVVVVGGGDSAAQEALALAAFAARTIVVHRGTALRAQAAYRAALERTPTIELRFGTIVEAVLGEQSVHGVRLRGATTGAASELEAAAVFVYVGLDANAGLAAAHTPLDLEGRIPVDGELRTALPGVWAVGAVRAGFGGRAAIAAGDGGTAAVSVDRYLRERVLSGVSDG